MSAFSVTHEFLATLENSAVAATYEAHLTTELILSGSYGDADPRALLSAAIESLQAARAAMGA